MIEDIVLKGNNLMTTQEETAMALRPILDNPNLVHVNLAETGLTYKVFVYLLPAIKLSTSLIAVHLSDNPFCFDDRTGPLLDFA